MDPTTREQEPPKTAIAPRESVAGSKAGTKTPLPDSHASAALAEAVRAARQSSKTGVIAGDRKSDSPLRNSPSNTSRLSFAAQTLVAAALIGTGWLASYAGTLANRDAIHTLEAETARSQDILARLSGDLDSLKGALAAFKDAEQSAAGASASDQAKLGEKVDRLTVAVQAPGAKLAAIETRLDRLEGQITAGLATLAAKPAVPTTAEAPAAREEAPVVKAKAETARTEPVDGWVLREVYNGAALIEGQNRRLYEVMPGAFLPGVGRVEAIERRGSRWVVLTDKGVISAYR